MPSRFRRRCSHHGRGGRPGSRIAGIAALLWGLAALAPARAAAAFEPLTQLARGALIGQNVATPVPGFELLVMLHGQLLYQQAFGTWRVRQVAATDSATKTMSGALIMSVAESYPATFALDTRLSSLLPSFDTASKRNITVRQAFSHTSGIANTAAGNAILANAGLTLQQSAAQIAQLPSVAPAGSVFLYGGVSMQAAGAAAEVAAGQPFTQLFNDRIAAPLGLVNTRFALTSASNPRVAGGLQSTAAEFGRFMDMLLNAGVDRQSGTRILAAASAQQMFTRQTDPVQAIIASPVDNSRYGIGTWLGQLEQAGPPVDQLAAGARGFHSWIDQASGVVFVFATDRTSFSNVDLLSSMMHVAVLSAVPEPATRVLLLLGAGGVWLLMRRQCDGAAALRRTDT